MKCRLTVEREIWEPVATPELISQCVRRNESLFAPPGAIVDDPSCYWIVLLGQAEPADDECAEIVAKYRQNPEERLRAARRLAAMIRPEDFSRFDAGELLGYDADGNDILGPNAPPAQSPTEEW